MDMLEKTRQEIIKIMKEKNWDNELVDVLSARPLSALEAIGVPERDDYPILKGKEVMVEAVFRGAKGQAYTDQPGKYCGTLKEIIELPLNNNFQRAVFIATVNAVLRYLGILDKTIHCKDREPANCARKLVEYLLRFGKPRIAFIGLQPGMCAELSKHFEMRVVDLDPENIGKRFGDIVVEGVGHTQEVIDWGDIILATGSSAVNDSLERFLLNKPVIFYGVTVAGIAYLNQLEQYCPCGH